MILSKTIFRRKVLFDYVRRSIFYIIGIFYRPDDPIFMIPLDYDEVLFYHDGNFFSRDNLHAGMMTLHPAGFPHGPHPKAVESIKNKTHTDEVAVMIDSWQPLHVDTKLENVEIQDYWKSWMKK